MTTVRTCLVVGLLAGSLLRFGCGGEEQPPPQTVERRDEPSEQQRALTETPQEETEHQDTLTSTAPSDY